MTPDQIKELIDRLLNSAEVLSSQAFQLAYRQVVVNAWTNIIAGGFIVLLLVAATVYIAKHGEDRNSTFYNAGEFAMVPGFLSIMVFVLAVIPGIQQALNPGWYSVRLLVDTFLK
jgi:hypothetical protein